MMRGCSLELLRESDGAAEGRGMAELDAQPSSSLFFNLPNSVNGESPRYCPEFYGLRGHCIAWNACDPKSTRHDRRSRTAATRPVKSWPAPANVSREKSNVQLLCY